MIGVLLISIVFFLVNNLGTEEATSFSGISKEINDAVELIKIKNAIKDKAAKWEADETSVSRLSEEERKFLTGTIIDFESFEGQGAGKPSKPGVGAPRNPKKGEDKLPRKFDWRSKDDQNWVSTVKDQRGCGSCWAFGIVAQLESVKMIADNTPDSNLDLSEQYMVSCDSNNYGCRGGYMIPAYNFLIEPGVPEESCFPYIAKDAETGAPCDNACANPQLVKISTWNRVTTGWSKRDSINNIKRAVYENPLTVTMYVYRDFFYYTGGVYKYVSGPLAGGHAVTIVGWNDRDKAFIVKNSWGSGWGENGYFRIEYSQVLNEVHFGAQAGDFDM